MLMPAAQRPPMAPGAPAPTGVPAAQQALPTAPVKPVTNITIEEPNINAEILELFKDKSGDELKALLTDKAKLEEIYQSIAFPLLQRCCY